MTYAQYLRQLLAPLGIYQLNAPFQGGELDALGDAFDQVEGALEELNREACLATAEDWGLEQVASLFRRRPPATTVKTMREALAALLRIGGDSFTLAALNDTISGCGIPAVVEEAGVGRVTVSFPGVAGEPEDFDELKLIIEEILPVHLDIAYAFWYLTWTELETMFGSWQEIEDLDLTWEELETCVEYL